MSENPKKVFTPSPYQAKFFDFVANGNGSAIVKAVAGSGKTTSCIEALAYVPVGQTVKLLAFNTTIATELNERIASKFADVELDTTVRAHYNPQYVTASTFHSLCFGVVRKHLEARKVRIGKPDGGKLRTLARNWLSEPDYNTYGDFAIKLCSLAKGQGIGCLNPDTTDVWMELVSHHDLSLDTDGASEEQGVKFARDLLARSINAANGGIIDFDDMLYLVCLWKLRPWQNDWVFIDEAQDTNPVRRSIAKLALKSGGRLVAVGDEKQAIYGFTGASHDAIELIKKDFKAIELPLTVSYRCSKAVVAMAQTIVPYIESHEDAPEGEMSHLDLDKAIPFLTAHDAILCRQTNPLIKLAFMFIAKGIGCKVLGRDIGAGLVSLIKKAKAKGLNQLETKLTTYRDREVVKFTNKGEPQKAASVEDKVACIFTVINSLDENSRTIPALIDAIERLFSDTNGCLVLSTIHKAKGREWNTVAILRADLMPSKWATQDWMQVQEQNLMYVAYTRAKQHLIFINKEKGEK